MMRNLKKIIVSAVVDTFLKVKMKLLQAHRVRTVMQNYYLFKKGKYVIKDWKIHENEECCFWCV